MTQMTTDTQSEPPCTGWHHTVSCGKDDTSLSPRNMSLYCPEHLRDQKVVGRIMGEVISSWEKGEGACRNISA